MIDYYICIKNAYIDTRVSEMEPQKQRILNFIIDSFPRDDFERAKEIDSETFSFFNTYEDYLIHERKELQHIDNRVISLANSLINLIEVKMLNTMSKDSMYSQKVSGFIIRHGQIILFSER